jgi:flagellar biosynthetic protein FliR
MGLADELTQTVTQFVLTLTRVSGFLSFANLPGWRATPWLARGVFALSLSSVIWFLGPRPGARNEPQWMIDFVLGVGLGVLVSLTREVVDLTAQMLSLQAGLSYASTIDPNSESDSNVLIVIGQLLVSGLFLEMGADHALIRLLAGAHPVIRAPLAGQLLLPVMEHAGAMFLLALRLGMGAVVLLIAIDLLMSLLNRLEPQLQLVGLTFPVKIAATLLLLWLAVAPFPAIFGPWLAEFGRRGSLLMGR